MNGSHTIWLWGALSVACSTTAKAPNDAAAPTRHVVAQAAAPSPTAPLTASNAMPADAPETPAPHADPDVATIRTLRRAASLYATFIEKAGQDPSYADAVRRSRERLADIEQTIDFLEKGLAERAGQ
jgi:hypothetical protein